MGGAENDDSPHRVAPNARAQPTNGKSSCPRGSERGHGGGCGASPSLASKRSLAFRVVAASSQRIGPAQFGTDPLTDTPECTTFSWSCPDGKNVMLAAFWGASGGSGIVASDQQRAIIQGSPLYRAFPSGTLELRRPPSAAPDAEHQHAELALAAGLCGTELRQRRLRAR
jgi:hypothetical protein